MLITSKSTGATKTFKILSTASAIVNAQFPTIPSDLTAKADQRNLQTERDDFTFLMSAFLPTVFAALTVIAFSFCAFFVIEGLYLYLLPGGFTFLAFSAMTLTARYSQKTVKAAWNRKQIRH
jgi:hypothetical protein